MFRNKSHGFTLLETAAAVLMVSLLVGVLTPAVYRARADARGMGSAANLAFISQGSAMYGADHNGRIFSFTWEPGLYTMPDGRTRFAMHDDDAAAWQQTEILMRRTGRIDGEDRFHNSNTRLPHHRTLLLVLQDYLDRPFPDPMVADPSDANLLQWQANPTDITADNNIPYAEGVDTTGYDNPTGWNLIGIRQRWAFSSSYLSTVSAWNPDGLNGERAYRPVDSTPHLLIGGPNIQLAQGRNFAEVAFPSAKVYFFEEFDRRQAGSPYFAYDHARPMKLMFDGSINDRLSGEAGPSWNPANGKEAWRQTYVPLHTFPIPLGGFGDGTLLSQRYRLTLGGLTGIDYGAPLMRR